MEIKIDCSCGTRYGFDVEPENGRMPVAVGCPSCGADGTTAANARIQARLASAGSSRPVRIHLGTPASAPAPVVSPSATSAPPTLAIAASTHTP